MRPVSRGSATARGALAANLLPFARRGSSTGGVPTGALLRPSNARPRRATARVEPSPGPGGAQALERCTTLRGAHPLEPLAQPAGITGAGAAEGATLAAGDAAPVAPLVLRALLEAPPERLALLRVEPLQPLTQPLAAGLRGAIAALAADGVVGSAGPALARSRAALPEPPQEGAALLGVQLLEAPPEGLEVATGALRPGLLRGAARPPAALGVCAARARSRSALGRLEALDRPAVAGRRVGGPPGGGGGGPGPPGAGGGAGRGAQGGLLGGGGEDEGREGQGGGEDGAEHGAGWAGGLVEPAPNPWPAEGSAAHRNPRRAQPLAERAASMRSVASRSAASLVGMSSVREISKTFLRLSWILAIRSRA